MDMCVHGVAQQQHVLDEVAQTGNVLRKDLRNIPRTVGAGPCPSNKQARPNPTASIAETYQGD